MRMNQRSIGLSMSFGMTARMTLAMGAATLLFAGAVKAQTIAISPSYTTVGVNGTVQYTAQVTGLANTQSLSPANCVV